MKKVLFYINTLEYGGAERVISNLCNRFATKGYEVIMATSYHAEPEYPLSENVKRVVFFENKETKRFKRNIKLIASLRKLIRAEQIDVVVSFMAEPNIRAILASIFLHRHKTVVSIRNDPCKEYSGMVLTCMSKLLFSFADGIVVQTRDAMEWLPKRLRRKATILKNQVADIFFETEASGERHGIFSVGRLEKQKNHNLLIRAFAAIQSTTTENLYIIGDGSLRKDLEKQVRSLHLSDRIFLCGTTDHVAETIADAELFVLPSDYEGSPNALIEAMAEGLLCIATDCPCGGPRELIRDGENGFLVSTNDESSLARAITHVFQMTEDRKEQIRRNAKITAAQFRGDYVFDRWEEFLSVVESGEVKKWKVR